MPSRQLLDVISGVANGESLERTLQVICEYVQTKQPDALCTAMLHDPGTNTLRVVAGTDLNERVIQLLSKLTPAVDGGSCAAAFQTKHPVIVADTHVDPRWAGARQFAQELGVRGCWSLPFFGTDGVPVGTFAFSRAQPGAPSAEVLQTLELGAEIAGLATRHFQASQTARKVQRFRDAIIEAASEGICACRAIEESPFVRFSIWNDRMTQITGYTMEEINASGWYQSLYPDPDLQRRAAERMDRMRHGENLLGEEWEITRKDGQRRIVAISTSAVVDDAGHPAVVAMMQDMSDHRLLQRQLFHAQKLELLGRLAGGVAHDFNNLLTALLGNVDIAEASLHDPAELGAALSEIRGVADRASRLTRQLLMLAKQEQVKPETININAQLRDAHRLLQRILGDPIRLSAEYASDLWNTRIDVGQFGQIIVNLAVNARDAMGGRGEFIVRTENVTINSSGAMDMPPAGDYVLLSASDSGEGMSPEIARRIFEPFFTTKRAQQGTGLGLATVYEIVSLSGGFIFVDSEHGRGATFRVYLPRCGDALIADRRAARTVPKIPGSALVLVVEDYEAVRSVIVATLERTGCQVIEARSGAEALQVIDRRGDQIKLMITDLLMPGMNGRELVERVRRTRPHLRVLLMSGNLVDANFDGEWQMLNVSFIAKPFSADDLMSRVVALVQESVAAPP